MHLESTIKKIFVTGGAGFIGSNLVEHYDKTGQYHIVVYDNLKSGFKKNIESFKNVTYIEGDILNYGLLSESMKNCEKVFHFAAEISVPASMLNPLYTEEVNTIGTMNILKAMVENGVKTIVFASSAAVYGDSEVCPKTIEMLPNPISPYAITKLAGEYYINMFVREHNINGVVCRFFNVFGERQNPKSAYAAAIPIFITKALSGEPLTIYGDGEQVRDFIYVKDLVNYLAILSDSKSGLYNIGYGNYITINGLAKSIVGYLNSNSEIIHDKPRLGDVKYSYANVDGIKQLGKIDLIGFERGLKSTIDYFKGLINRVG